MDWLPHQVYVLCLATILDVALGDPPSRWHPVAWMGTVISAFRRQAPTHGRALPFLAGALFMVAGIGFCATVGLMVESLLWGGQGGFPIATEMQGKVPRQNSGRQEGRNPREFSLGLLSNFRIPDGGSDPEAEIRRESLCRRELQNPGGVTSCSQWDHRSSRRCPPLVLSRDAGSPGGATWNSYPLAISTNSPQPLRGFVSENDSYQWQAPPRRAVVPLATLLRRSAATALLPSLPPLPGFLASCLPYISWKSLDLFEVTPDVQLGHPVKNFPTPARLPPIAAIFIEALLLKLAFSVRGLAQAGRAVRLSLERNDLTNARELVATHLVSRDTRSLTESQLAAATIESLAENTSDSIVAPLLYYALAGLPGLWVYRFINTCDAMLGYRDAEREWLGKAAARLDDLVNLIPSRLTAGLMLLVGLVRRQASRQALRVWWRDCRATASPNAGHPMSAAAGLLGVELEKVGHYKLGRGQRLPGASDIHRTTRLMWGTWLAALAVTFVLVLALK